MSMFCSQLVSSGQKKTVVKGFSKTAKKMIYMKRWTVPLISAKKILSKAKGVI